MKYTTYLFLLFIALFLNGCSDDKNEPEGGGGGKNDDRPETLAWIEDTMRDEYYWYKEIPEADKLNYNGKPEDFFKSLLSRKDGKDYGSNHYYYSYIEDLSKNTRGSIQTNYSYGFEFTIVNYGDEIRALILYVLPDSPASEAKLKRGNWISKIDNTPLTSKNYSSLYGAGKCKLTIVEWDLATTQFVNPKEVEITSARPVEDNPVFHFDILTSPVKEKQVGYLVYNHFTDGKNDNDKSYDNELRTASAFFKGVDEFVLDLRYNNGGLLSSAMLLCAILAPETALNKSFGYIKYNEKKSPQKAMINVTSSLLAPGGKNLNLKTLYVLVSSSSASSSEMVINSLRPFMGDKNVILIGEQTEGKNVGSSPFTSDDKQWKLHPITCQIYNSADFTDYADGFTPNHEMNEAFIFKGEYAEPVELLPLGDPDERLLHAAISLIDGWTPTRSDAISSGKPMFKESSIRSIDRKATNGVIIDK